MYNINHDSPLTVLYFVCVSSVTITLTLRHSHSTPIARSHREDFRVARAWILCAGKTSTKLRPTGCVDTGRDSSSSGAASARASVADGARGPRRAAPRGAEARGSGLVDLRHPRAGRGPVRGSAAPPPTKILGRRPSPESAPTPRHWISEVTARGSTSARGRQERRRTRDRRTRDGRAGGRSPRRRERSRSNRAVLGASRRPSGDH